MPSRYGPKVTAFYHSSAWRKCAQSFMQSKRYICQRCGKTMPGQMIVHHKIRLNERNVDDANISLNWNNLELLCIDCHNKEHFGTKEEDHFDVTFTADGDVIVKEKPK